jgi:hypothetical protein
MASKSAIINRALSLAGAGSIVDIDDESVNANIANRVYDFSLRSVLSECEWNFAKKRANLTLTTDTLDFYYDGRKKVYNQPADVIRVYGTNPRDASIAPVGKYFVSDSAGLGIEYVAYSDSPSIYPTFFIDALTDKFVSEISYQISNNRTLGVEYYEKYIKISLPRAEAQNAQTGDQQFIQDDAWELARFQDININA